MHMIQKTLITLAATVALSASALAGTLVINSDQADPAPKAAFAQVVKDFEAANPDIKVKMNTFDKEAYKTALEFVAVSYGNTEEGKKAKAIVVQLSK